MIKKVYKIQDTPAEQDYHGCGDSLLVLKNDIPQKLLYIPEEEKENVETQIKIDPKNVAEIYKSTEVWRGMASCYEFCCMERLFPQED
jgi:hypothetical protein